MKSLFDARTLQLSLLLPVIVLLLHPGEFTVCLGASVFPARGKPCKTGADCPETQCCVGETNVLRINFARLPPFPGVCTDLGRVTDECDPLGTRIDYRTSLVKVCPCQSSYFCGPTGNKGRPKGMCSYG